MKLKQNLGPTDGLIRAVLGIGLFVIANFVVEGVADGILELLGAILILTAVIGYSPVYALFKISTRKPDQS
ncbi:YgaP family membrane protein [Dehalogenimonas etheniformans]|uniref:DUF2892 domain-containing protein n=1 Tax=Dehalogenimonas etheniformans TaxID=1536648 RepID=A0A2P5P895_9CHLR|nr:DUF2892 domain-containing protein [Dehalogenimonas etheniformans]PPD58522.1 DUF2892 domain-containing protein [Dehalogenimonas etheniformans]QNT76714.1 DUF2892 domain-containing protein [Dehalogenimonas etheniformans]